MARTYRRKSDTYTPNPRLLVARFERDRPIDLGLLSKAFVELARAAAEHDAQQSIELRKEGSHEKSA
jgi:hypothetical protein